MDGRDCKDIFLIFSFLFGFFFPLLSSSSSLNIFVFFISLLSFLFRQESYEVDGIYLDYSVDTAVLIEYFKASQNSSLLLQWSSPSLGIPLQVVPTSVLSHYSPCACVLTGFTGTYCTVLANNCGQNPCQNGGTCINGFETYTCSCSAGFTGDLCTTPGPLAL